MTTHKLTHGKMGMAYSIVKVRVGARHIRFGEYVSLSRLGYLKPAASGEIKIGIAKGFLGARRVVDFVNNCYFKDPCLVDAQLGKISASYLPSELLRGII